MRCSSMISIPFVAAKLTESLPQGVVILVVDDSVYARPSAPELIICTKHQP